MADKDSTVNEPPMLDKDTVTSAPPREEQIKLLKPMVGTSTARFFNQYNPYNDKPLERPTPNQGMYMDPELTRLLAEERQSKRMHEHHKRKDWMKSYWDEWVKFQSITKGK